MSRIKFCKHTHMRACTVDVRLTEQRGHQHAVTRCIIQHT